MRTTRLRQIKILLSCSRHATQAARAQGSDLREVVDAAGVPRAVWNMFARHGGTTEAQQAGVNLADIAEHAQHADINTTRKHYIVPSVETSRRVAKQRVAHRQVKKNTP